MSDLVDRQNEHVFYTWSAQKNAFPLEIVDGQGARFETADGARWWDLGSMTWNASLGHGHPRMREALAEAASKGLLAYPTSVFPSKVRAGELLAEVTPAGLTKSFICLSGAEANENAVKIARLVTGRKKVVARTRSYHGATLAMLSLSGDPRREKFEPGLPGIARFGDPYCFRCPFGKEPTSCHHECAEDLETTLLREGPETVAAVIAEGIARFGDPYCFRCPFGKEPTSCSHECAQDLETTLLREGPDTVAAVIAEGIVGANGVFVPPPGYWKKVRAICDKYGVLLISDEVLSGFGRTGKWFAVDHDGVSPDLMTMAKGITGGYAPGGAVIVNDKIAKHFDDEVLWCGLTTYAHPLVCAAIVAAIETYRDDGLIERAATLGPRLGAGLAAIAKRRPEIAEVRGIGLLWALELCEPGTKTPLGGPALAKIAATLRAHHLHLHKRENLVYVAPPLVISEIELEEATTALGRALDEALS